MTDSQSWTSDAPLVIAHRGASLLAPENTMAAFVLAAELGADAIELDVKLSRDGVPVVHHDMTLERTTNGSGRIKDSTLAELKRLDAGKKFHTSFSGERIPTLEEVIIELDASIMINIELTNYNAPLDILPFTVLNLIKRFHHERFLLSSFNPLALRRVKKVDPTLRTALLLFPGIPRWAAFLLQALTPWDDLHPHYQSLTPSLCTEMHTRKKRVNVWTVNHPEDLRTQFAMGVNGIITDDVKLALEIRRDVVS